MDPQNASATAKTHETRPSDEVAPDTGTVLLTTRIARFGVGFFVFGILWILGLQIVAAVLLPQRLRDIGVDSPEALLGTMMALTAVVSLVSNLVFGNLSDRTRNRFGRRTPWILCGGLLGGASLTSIGFIQSPVAITVVYCLCMVGLNMMLAPGVAVLSDRIPMRLRGTMSGFFGAGTVAGAPLGSIVGASFITNPIPGFILAGALLLGSALVCLVVWPREPSAEDLPVAGGGFVDLVRSFRPPRKAPDFYRAFMSRLFMLLGYQMIMAYQLYIVQDHLGQTVAQSAATIATMSTITLVVSLIGSLASGPLSDFLKRRRPIVVAASLLFALGIAMPWIWPTSTGMFLFAAIAGFGYGVYSSVDQALNVDVLPNEKEAGKDLGILNLSTTAGQTIGPLVTSWIVVGTGGYSVVFPVAIVAAILGAFFITRIRSVR